MNLTLTVSEQAYKTLERKARNDGKSVEQWLEEEAARIEMEERQALFARINHLRAELFARYGEQPDSTSLIREDRDR